jgi:ammonia channel protein AmtB
VWIFFPILALDYIDPNVASHTPYTGAYSVIFALCAATITAFLVSPLFNDGILIRDVIYGPIAGGVACSTASYWILNPAYAIVIGVCAGLLQVIVMNVIEKRFAREKYIYHSYSFTLFGAQGLLGAIFAAIWNAAVRGQQYGFTFTFNLSTRFSTHPVFSWIVSLISLSMGAIFGLLVGLLCYLVATHLKEDHFDDFTYWINDDGLRAVQDAMVTNENDAGIRIKSNIIKGKRAYL